MQFLLERLANAPRSGGVAPGVGAPPGFDLKVAVLEQIQRLLCIHVSAGDNGLHLMDMTLPALADAQDPSDQQRFAARLLDLIGRHEARL